MKRVILSIVVFFILISSIYLLPSTSSQDKSGRIAFLVNSSIYPEIKDELCEVFEKMEYYDFVMEDIQNQNPSQIRAWLKMQYENYGLVGAVLVGDIPLARYHNPIFNETSDFPYYYMNLDGLWKDENGDGIIDSIPQNYTPQIWVGILRSTDMDGNNITQISNYIQRVLKYFDGKIGVEPKSGAFIDNDFLWIVDKLGLSLSYPYVGYKMVDNSTKDAFLKFINESYPYAFIVVHSNGTEYFIKQDGILEPVYPWEIKSRVLFYVDQSCYGGDFNKGAIANHLIMSKNSQSLGVLTFTAMGTVSDMESFHMALGKGESFGDALLHYIQNVTHNATDFNRYIAMLSYLGFPFLKPWRPSGYKEMPPISIDGNQELRAYAKKYGWPGKGTEKDPIQITGIMIFTGYWRDGLSLGNISIYVKIHNCYILVRNGNGISIGYSSHVEIENNKLYYAGIYIADSSNISVSQNEIKWGFTYVGHTIDLTNVSNAEILGNRILTGYDICVGGKFSYVKNGHNWTMMPHYVKNITVANNVLMNVTDGITLYIVKNSKILRNVVNFKNTGLMMIYSHNNSIEENNFTMHFIIRNYLYSRLFYILLFNSCNNSIYLNNFFYSENIPQYVDFHEFFSAVYFKLELSTINYWNTSKYGNYYQWWSGKNDTNDKNGDGIVDYPWVIDENNTDYRPLKKPFVWEMGSKEERAGREDFIFYLLIFLLFVAIIGSAFIWKFCKKNVES